MQQFELEIWHILAFFGTILVGIFKDDITTYIKNFSAFRKRQFAIGGNRGMSL